MSDRRQPGHHLLRHGLARSWELLGPGTGGLITEIAEHAESVLRRGGDQPPDGSPPQQ